MKLVFDSNAWIEYLQGTEKSQAVEKFLSDYGNEIYTTAANLYEVKYLTLRDEGRQKAEDAVLFIKNHAEIILIDEELALNAAELRASHGLSAIDAFTLAAAQKLDAKIVSADPHFTPFKKHLLKL